MRNLLAGVTASIVLAALPIGFGHADEDTTARLREQLRRTQEALRQAQTDNADLTRAKLDAQQKLQTATKQIDSVKSSSNRPTPHKRPCKASWRRRGARKKPWSTSSKRPTIGGGHHVKTR